MHNINKKQSINLSEYSGSFSFPISRTKYTISPAMSSVDNAWVTPGPMVLERDSYSVLRPMTLFARAFGIFPLSLKGPVGGRKYSTSYAWLTYSAALFVSTMTNLLMKTEESLNAVQVVNFPAILQACVYFELIFQILSTTSVYLSVTLGKRKLADTINSLCAQDEALQILQIRLDHRADFKQSCIRLGVIVSTFVMLQIYDFVHLLEANSRNPLDWITWTLVRVMRMFGSCLFAEITLVLKKKLTMLNKNLRKLIKESEDEFVEIIFTRSKNCAEMRLIAQIHGDMCDYASSLNEIFGVSMVIGVILALAIFTSGFYYIINEILNADNSFLKMGGGVTWMILGTADIIYTLVVCSLTKNEASLTGKLIHKLHIHAGDTALNTVIRNFSLQLHHKKLAFSGAGLFPLDATLIVSMVGTVTTYLVIMIQFDSVKW